MTLSIGKEPEGLLIQRADVLGWVPGLTPKQWKKIRPTLREHFLPGCARPYYFKAEIREKIVEPIKGTK
jgi:hypothetical protein